MAPPGGGGGGGGGAGHAAPGTHFSLAWDKYRHSVCAGLGHLQRNGEFVDMTIAADGHLVKAHQLVVSLASPYLKQLIQSAPCPHPVIFLNNVSHPLLCSLLEYIYSGEVSVPADKLTQFIETAKALHIKGLDDMIQYGDSSTTDSQVFEHDQVQVPTITKQGLGSAQVQVLGGLKSEIRLPASARNIVMKREFEHVSSPVPEKKRHTQDSASEEGYMEHDDGGVAASDGDEDDNNTSVQSHSAKDYKLSSVVSTPGTQRDLGLAERRHKAPIWKFFKCCSKENAQCNLCHRMYRYHYGISNLHRHLKRMHTSVYCKEILPHNRMIKDDVEFIDLKYPEQNIEVPEFFTQNDDSSVLCALCSESIPCNEGEYEHLIEHLKDNHDMIVTKTNDNVNDPLEDETSNDQKSNKNRIIECKISIARNHFTKTMNSNTLRCIHCLQLISVPSNGTSSNMSRHLHRQHPELSDIILFEYHSDIRTFNERKKVKMQNINKFEDDSVCLEESNEEPLIKRKISSKVWNYFTEAGGKAVCKFCSKPFYSRNTTNLFRHLSRKHERAYQSINVVDNSARRIGALNKVDRRKSLGYFTDITARSAQCTLCFNDVKICNGRTNLTRHLRRKHKQIYNELFPDE